MDKVCCKERKWPFASLNFAPKVKCINWVTEFVKFWYTSGELVFIYTEVILSRLIMARLNLILSKQAGDWIILMQMQ
jgi:hypothetical protein